jgi:hypothetical protein
MANDGSCKSNHGDNNDVESSPPSMLEQLLIVQAQLHTTVQQILVQMQNVNQLMQSMEAIPSSRKRKSNTHDDLGKAQKINATKEAIPNTTEVPRHVSNVERLAIFPIDAPKTKEIESATIVERMVTMIIDAPTLVVDLSSLKPRKRRWYIQKIKDGYDPDLDHYYVEDGFPKDRSHH